MLPRQAGRRALVSVPPLAFRGSRRRIHPTKCCRAPRAAFFDVLPGRTWVPSIDHYEAKAFGHAEAPFGPARTQARARERLVPLVSLPDARLRQFQSSSWAPPTRSGLGLAASLAHPGGNATGSSNVAPDLSAKLLGTFAQLVPGMSSVGVVVNPANPGAVTLARWTAESLVDLARALTDSALETLKTIMRDPQAPAAARATCANSILDRGWGRAIEKKEDVTPQRSKEEINAELRQLLWPKDKVATDGRVEGENGSGRKGRAVPARVVRH